MPPIRPEIAQRLLAHGVRVTDGTDPARVRAFLNELYVFEIREARLRRRELEGVLGPQPLADYRARVAALRASYELLSVPIQRWCNQPRPSGPSS